MISDKPKPPFRLLPLPITDVAESEANELWLEAGIACGDGGSREDGRSTPALGAT